MEYFQSLDCAECFNNSLPRKRVLNAELKDVDKSKSGSSIIACFKVLYCNQDPNLNYEKVFKKLLEDYFAQIYRINKVTYMHDEYGYHRRDKYLFFHFLIESKTRNFAKMALRDGIYKTWESQDFFISLAPFWLQPCFDKYIEENFPKNSETFCDENYLAQLNDDCLDVIYKNLTLRDQINLLKISDRFESVIESKITFTEADYLFTDKKDLYSLLHRKGNFIKEINLSSENDHVLFLCHLISKFCENLKTLRIQIYLENDFARVLEFRKILYRFENLEKFQIDAEYDQNHFWKQTIRYLPDSLKVLIVSEVGNEYFVESFPFIPSNIDKIVFTNTAGLTNIRVIIDAVKSFQFFKEVNKPKHFTIIYTVTERLRSKLENNSDYIEAQSDGNIRLIDDADADLWKFSF